MKHPAFRINRLFSDPLAALLLKTPLSPNQVTCLGAACGVAAGGLFAAGDYAHSLWGAALYVLAALLDNCDGEIARAKNLGSAFGGWLDIASDFVTDAALFIGIGLGQWGRGNDLNVGIFLALCLSGAVFHCALVVLEKLRGFGPAVYGASNTGRRRIPAAFSGVFDALREGDACWLVLGFALAGKAHTLLWFGGVYMQALWLSALLLNARGLLGRP